MAENQFKFTTLNGKLCLKLMQGDATYTKELEEIKKRLPDSVAYRNALGNAITGLTLDAREALLPPIIHVAKETGCVSEDFIYLERELLELDGKTSDIQTTGLRKILKKPFPADADESDKRAFYSRCMGMSIASGNTELITEMIQKLEALEEGN